MPRTGQCGSCQKFVGLSPTLVFVEEKLCNAEMLILLVKLVSQTLPCHDGINDDNDDDTCLHTWSQAGLNLDDAVARMGLFGTDGKRLWVTTSTEALYAWDWAAACDEMTEGAAFSHHWLKTPTWRSCDRSSQMLAVISQNSWLALTQKRTLACARARYHSMPTVVNCGFLHDTAGTDPQAARDPPCQCRTPARS